MVESHGEKEIFKKCVELMQDMVWEFEEYLEYLDIEVAEDERFRVSKTNFEIVQKLFLSTTDHSGGNSTREKCAELGLDSTDYQVFKIPNENFE